MDDPVWSEPMPAVLRRPPKHPWRSFVGKVSDKRGWVGLFIVVVLLIVGGVSFWLLRPPGGGDPGGLVFRELKQISAAVPPGASTVKMSATPVEWLQPCPGLGDGQPGWSRVYVSVSFTDLANPAVVVTQISSALHRMGWQRHDTVPTPGQGKVAHWALNVHKGQLASAFAFPVPAESSHWSVSATWQPPGPVGYGCP
jgi:hypothetical protein